MPIIDFVYLHAISSFVQLLTTAHRTLSLRHVERVALAGAPCFSDLVHPGDTGGGDSTMSRHVRKSIRKRSRFPFTSSAQPLPASRAYRLRGELLESRRMLTDWSGAIVTDTVWDDVSEPYNLVGDVFVRSGATLTIGPGVTVTQSSGNYELFVADDGLGARLMASGVDFQAGVYLYQTADGTLTNNTVRRSFAFQEGSSSTLVVGGNHFEAAPSAHPEFVPRLVGNTFASGSRVDVYSRVIDSDTLWPNIPNVDSYRLFEGDVFVRSGATLTIDPGVTVCAEQWQLRTVCCRRRPGGPPDGERRRFPGGRLLVPNGRRDADQQHGATFVRFPGGFQLDARCRRQPLRGGPEVRTPNSFPGWLATRSLRARGSMSIPG